MKLWEGRFAAPTAADADAFNESLSFDKKLYKADITASLAHSEMLGRCGILSDEDLFSEISRLCDAERRGNGSSRMSRIITIIFAFFAFGEAGNPTFLAQGGKTVGPTAQQLIGITLMPDVKYDFIFRKIKDIKERHRRFHGAEIGSEMSAALHNGFVNHIPDLIAQNVEFASGTLLDILRLPFFQHTDFSLLSCENSVKTSTTACPHYPRRLRTYVTRSLKNTVLPSIPSRTA